jgi:hypothetical protein
MHCDCMHYNDPERYPIEDPLDFHAGMLIWDLLTCWKGYGILMSYEDL